ncbi:ABC transporter permease [Mycolicibacterium neoaurum]|uniref:ABC transporter permease n=1 Tax=Mycolicibacterium neoaurum TaxID=1795 RepID=UPI00248B9764|nr:ABC transporter permease [Mycolicibacterium neoaurum]MDO3400418.1 ABC transporter permease [Mycolicibacterium neoaurum]WBP92622.1 ABC transporter permease [Mycolicibacterium neoaurum]WBS06602.1 ABC transporter permease [Mycolicibacterium neoaurum]
MSLDPNPTDAPPQRRRVPDEPPMAASRRMYAALAPRWLGFYVLVGLIILFSTLLPYTFPTTANASAILGNESVGMMLAIALLIPVVAGHFDLSVASILTLAMIASIGLFQFFSAPVWVACLAGPVIGAGIGLINGFCVAWLKINSLVATLATGSCALGAALWWTNGSIFAENVPASFRALGERVLGIPLPVVYTLVVCMIAWWTLERTPVGRYLYAIGDNPDAARLVGLPTAGLTTASFVASGTIAGTAGVIQAAILGSGNPQVGASFLLPAFAAVFLGATVFHIGRYNVVGTVVAVLLLAVMVAGLQQFGLPFYIEPLLKGAILLAAVAFTTGRFSGKGQQ